MSEDMSTLEQPDESYFASFTDMLVGILFIFIILLMIAANNFQEATDSVAKKKNADMVAKINDAHEKALDQARNAEAWKTERMWFYEDREKVMNQLAQELQRSGVPVTVDMKQGVIMIPEEALFNQDQDAINPKGQKLMTQLAGLLGTYLPCISPTKDQSRVIACGMLNLNSIDGLDAVVIEDHPDANSPTDSKWLHSVQRSVSVFKSLTGYESYLDSDLKNMTGVPILNVNAHQDRRLAKNQHIDASQSKKVELRFIMRTPTPADVKKLRDAQDRANALVKINATQPATNGTSPAQNTAKPAPAAPR